MQSQTPLHCQIAGKAQSQIELFFMLYLPCTSNGCSQVLVLYIKMGHFQRKGDCKDFLKRPFLKPNYLNNYSLVVNILIYLQFLFLGYSSGVLEQVDMGCEIPDFLGGKRFISQSVL